MAIKTEYDIKFSCGHKETRDLSAKEAGKRASFATWLSQKKCTKCFRQDSSENDRIERTAAAESFDKDCRLDPMRGSDAQLKWASIIRMEVLTRAHDHLVMDGGITEDEFDQRILTYARKIGRAGWWFDNSKAEGEDLEELVTTAYHDAAEVDSENPF